MADAIIKQIADPMYKNWTIPDAVRDAIKRVCEDTPAAQSAGQEAVAEVRSKHGDPEVFGERELVTLTDIQKLPYGTKFYAAPVNGGERETGYQPYSAHDFTNLVAENSSLRLDVQRLEKQVLQLNEELHTADLVRAADAPQVGNLRDDQVEWVVNDIAELGVKIGQQFFWLYKGRSLVYEEAKHDDGSPMHWRHVFKREFGECAHPINRMNPEMIGTVSLDDSEDWRPLPDALTSPAKEQK
ncbi:hypothetical protein [Pandoraea iniqua]|uniref:hypothetical protein n=1 Tax=Pandoraea iniqua TaxID=2508288 RepID=UPI001242FF26|nr:hypothetical protein [Pandoraea iniqua]